MDPILDTLSMGTPSSRRALDNHGCSSLAGKLVLRSLKNANISALPARKSVVWLFPTPLTAALGRHHGVPTLLGPIHGLQCLL